MMNKSISRCLFLMIIPVFIHSQDLVIPLWPDGVPGAIVDSTYIESMDTDQPWRIRDVSNPTISVYFPSDDLANGTAIVICPGGGYVRLAFDHEGFEVAEWLNSLGITGIVLKYRLPSDRIMKDKSIGPLQDVQEAIRSVRRHAQEWGIDPEKVGVMGFSAGGHLAATASTLYSDNVYESIDSVSARPEFSVLIYPVISFRDSITHKGSRFNLLGDEPALDQIHRFSTNEQVSKDTPPAFLVHSADDHTVPIMNSLLYFEGLRENNISCELHFFESGGHGYGLNRGKGSELSWPNALIHWMKMHEWI